MRKFLLMTFVTIIGFGVMIAAWYLVFLMMLSTVHLTGLGGHGRDLSIPEMILFWGLVIAPFVFFFGFARVFRKDLKAFSIPYALIPLITLGILWVLTQ